MIENATRAREIFLACAVAFCGCKKHEAAQQVAPTETGPIVAATAPASVSVETIASAAPVASASVAAASSSGPSEAEKHIAREAALAEAREFGMMGLVGAADGGALDPNQFGAGGLGLSGADIGTLSHRDGGTSSAPSIRQGSVSVNGRLPPEVIQRIVRQNFGRFRLCYTTGLRSNPHLQGRVSTKFVIDRDGSVKSTQDAGSDMPDSGVTMCVVRAFGNLSYPQPEGGIVTVVFPLIFAPSS